MANVGAVNIRIGAITADFVASMRAAGASADLFARQLNTNLAAGFAQADRQSKVFEKGFGRLAGDLKGFGSNLTLGVTAPVLGLGAAMFKTYAEVNANIQGFKALSGSTALAANSFKTYKEIAKLPG